MNLQIAEKQALEPNGLVDIHHAFPTIQGEGPFVGCPSCSYVLQVAICSVLIAILIIHLLVECTVLSMF